MKIRTRFTLVIGGLAAALFLGYGVSLAWVQKKSLSRQQDRANEDVVQRLAVVCQESLFSKDEIMLVNYLKEVKRSPDVRWAMFIRPDSQVVVHTDLARKNTLAEDVFAPLGRRPERPISVAGRETALAVYGAPVFRGGKPAGMAWVAYDAGLQAAGVKDALRSSLKRFGWVTLFCFIAGLVVAAAVARSLTVPIGRFMSAAQRLGEGDWGVRVEVKGKNELAKLADAFNEMSGKLAQLDRLKDEFVATVSHDLRNPLGAITMISRCLMEGPLNDADRYRLSANLVLSAERLRAMVNNNLDAARMKETHLEFQARPFSIEKVLAEIHALYTVQAEEVGREFILEAEAALPTVHGDEEKTHRIVTNLVSNAFKFTSRGDRITLRARPSDGSVQVTVRDTGPGIPPDDLGRLFHRFRTAERAGPAVKRQQGAGLGLAIAKVLAEGQGGRLWVESRPGEGTAFHFTLPREP